VHVAAGAFDDWSRRAVNDANAAQNAIDAVTFGASPGGLKEWKPMIDGATMASGNWRAQFIGHMRDVKGMIDTLGSPSVGVGAFAALAPTAGRSMTS
jgi:hypothetical protein